MKFSLSRTKRILKNPAIKSNAVQAVNDPFFRLTGLPGQGTPIFFNKKTGSLTNIDSSTTTRSSNKHPIR
jgi:hypothetical protein